MSWIKRNPSRINPEELTRKADESLRETKELQPKVNSITSYLERRKNQNGFGEDFEYTLKPKGAQ